LRIIKVALRHTVVLLLRLCITSRIGGRIVIVRLHPVVTIVIVGAVGPGNIVVVAGHYTVIIIKPIAVVVAGTIIIVHLPAPVVKTIVIAGIVASAVEPVITVVVTVKAPVAYISSVIVGNYIAPVLIYVVVIIPVDNSCSVVLGEQCSSARAIVAAAIAATVTIITAAVTAAAKIGRAIS